MRVIISTQGIVLKLYLASFFTEVPAEPTVLPPVIIDLCNVIILHRFQSPAWWNHIVKHVSADFSLGDAFDRVVRLQVSSYYLNGRLSVESFLTAS